MRPQRLILEGFGAFKSSTEIDFADLDLVAFVGQTGAGKSTIIDAIGFALYGSVPRYDKVNVVSPVIHQLSNEAKVSLEFELGGDVYIATRVVRRQNSKDPSKVRATTKEARLEIVVGNTQPNHPEASGRHPELDSGPDRTTKVLAGNVKELDASVEQLLGLSFAQFTKTIVLPQGAFARFLTDEPAERQKLIRRLLDLEIYSNMGSRARERAKKADAQIEVLVAERERHTASAAETDLESIEKTIIALDEFEKTFELKQSEIASIDSEIVPAAAEVERGELAVERLTGLTNPASGEGAQFGFGDVATTVGELDIPSAEGKVSELAAAVAASEKVEAKASAQILEAEAFSELESQIASFADLKRALAAQQNESAEYAEILSEQGLAEKEAKSSDKAVEKAKVALESARHDHQAADIQRHLELGDDCPICGSQIDEFVEHSGSQDLPKLESELENAQSKAKSGAAKLATLTGRLAEFSQRLETTNAEVEKLEKLTKGFDSVEILEKRLEQDELSRKALTAAQLDLKRAVAEHADALAELDRRRQAELGLMSSFSEVRDSVADLKPPAISDKGVVDNWQQLTDWAAKESLSIEQGVTSARQTVQSLKEKRNKMSSELLGRANELGLNQTQVADIVPAAQAARSQAESARKQYASGAAEVDRLSKAIAEAVTARDQDHALGRHLNATGFEGWLLAEALADISERATKRLLELTSGQFALEVVGRQFYIVDHNNASERRDVKTLSGGETFLASLALALGLADAIAELAVGSNSSSSGQVALGSMFLDEGFGTLDTETLDVVASAIEELAASGRMIGVVTHVRELAERLPVRFEVTKGPAGSWVEKVEL